MDVVVALLFLCLLLAVVMNVLQVVVIYKVSALYVQLQAYVELATGAAKQAENALDYGKTLFAQATTGKRNTKRD